MLMALDSTAGLGAGIAAASACDTARIDLVAQNSSGSHSEWVPMAASVSTPADDESLLPDGQQLADVLSEFARTMLTDFPIQTILDHLVERIVDILPISSAGVTLIAPGTEPQYIAATDADALRYERLQTELGEGPCLLAYHTGEAVTVPDLRTETRFPTFGPQAVSAGLSAVFTFPLSHGDHRLGALDLYRQHPGPLFPKAMSAAQTLADVVTAYLLNARSREDLQDSSDRSRAASLHDSLTGLPNRVLMLERIEEAFARSRRSGRSTAALFVDLDQFKSINDTYGHRVGDQLLVAVGRRVAALIRPGDTLARLSGDEFVAICDDLDSPDQAAAIGARLEAGLAPPFLLSGVEIAMTASIGIAYVNHSEHTRYSPKQLVHEADMAMYQAKREGGHRRIFQTHHLALTGLEQDLPGAQTRGEFHLEYQPILDTAHRRISGFEALLRWQHPTRGLVPPTVFIPLAEKAGLISSIGQWVLEQAWADRHRWKAKFGGADLHMSVNVSAHQLMSAGFTDTISDLLRSTDDRPELLILEITESVFIQDSERALLVLGDLKELGVTLALDDFGTGYSSLSYLKRFPVDIIKIDRTFIADLELGSASYTIVDAVVRLAHGLGMTVVAEGVETAEQLDRISAIGCDKCQGYYFARPTPAEDIHTLVGRARNPVGAGH
jgi:diguanylate cyclase (GGDEF)-like protein